MVGHAAPEAARGGPIAALVEGDTVVIDIAQRKIDIEVAPEILAKRLAGWKAPAARYRSGVFAKYSALVSSASDGAVTSVES